MTEPKGPYQFKDGSNAEDFANTVADALRGDDGELQVPGTAVIECEDFTLPDNVVMLGSTELQGTRITYFELFSGAVEYFHGLKVTTMRPVETGRAMMTPFSMALAVSVERPQVTPPQA